jgi:Nucleoside-diphosphate-sugar epimerases
MKALICGGHGFIGHHMARRLKSEGYWVRTVDIKEFPYGDLRKDVDDYVIGDLRDFDTCLKVSAVNNEPFDEVYQFAFWMGGAGVIFSGKFDAKIIHDSALLDLNMAEACRINKVGKIFTASSACVYNQFNQEVADFPITNEDSAYPAYPDSAYGWTKLFGEQIYQAYAKNYGMSVRIARFHNVAGPEGAWGNGREKSVAAMCRKIAETPDGGVIDVWGDGEQTRSFIYIDECLEGVRRFMNSDFQGPVNIGSEEMVSINHLVEIVKEVANKPNIKISHINGPLGVRGRNSDNRLIREKLGWEPDYPLKEAIEKIYPWVEEQVLSGKTDYAWTN